MYRLSGPWKSRVNYHERDSDTSDEILKRKKRKKERKKEKEIPCRIQFTDALRISI